MSERVAQIRENLERIEERIKAACDRAGRSRDEVQLVCVTKTRPLEDLRTLYTIGQRHFAENRVQDARERIPSVDGEIDWHFIGHLQTNKAKYLPGLVHWVHSVDKPEVAEALQKVWAKHLNLAPLKIFLQFNISGEEQKHGAGGDEAIAFLERARVCDRLSIQGLMCMAPYSEDSEVARPVFRGLKNLRDRLASESGMDLPHLSMGMSGDFEVAIEEGATMIRVGSAIFE